MKTPSGHHHDDDTVPVVPRKTVAIIGAGVSGLVAAKVFSTQGHHVVGFEQAGKLGGVWEESRSYPGVRTQTAHDLYRYTDLSYPTGTPEWPTGEHVRDYLQAYAEKHGLFSLFKFGITVREVKQVSVVNDNNNIDEIDTQQWRLTLENAADGSTFAQDVDFCVVCTGCFTRPKKPSFEGLENFSGTVLHSSEYKESTLKVEQDPKSKQKMKVVVIGGNRSATDVAVHAARQGAQVTMVMRRGVWRVPDYLCGGLYG